MTAYDRERVLLNLVPPGLIEDLGSPDLVLRRRAIEELKLLAVSERGLLQCGSWVASQPTYNALAYAFNEELRQLKQLETLWRRDAHEGQSGQHFPAAASV